MSPLDENLPVLLKKISIGFSWEAQSKSVNENFDLRNKIQTKKNLQKLCERKRKKYIICLLE
uniref:Uncharacterized protein n=1 Tax=Megaselia scalaris TaxID=36166 RepID=T1H028_MEGSC